MSGYEGLLQQLFALASGRSGRLDLSIITELCKALGNPQHSFRSIHVAGTNGKGSVSTMLAAAFSSCGAKVGLYTSPHIASFRERIRINGELISISAIEEFLPPILSLMQERQLPASFFEVTTALAFSYYFHLGVEVAVIETGLGGRLDATNVVMPELTVITSISADHTELLGYSLEEIALEKAGIIKRKVPLVIGPKVPLEVILPVVTESEVTLYQIQGNYLDYREENRAIAGCAMALLGIEPSISRFALEQLPPCRFEKHVLEGVSVIFDVAHNPAGLERLAALLHLEGRRYEVVIALSATKELSGSLKPLLALTDRWHLVSAPNGRSHPQDRVFEELKAQGAVVDSIACYPEIEEGIRQAFLNASVTGHTLLICGSFFIMARARKALGIVDECDSFDLNEGLIPTRC